MKIKVLEEKPGAKILRLDVTGISPAFANAFRRVSMMNIPTLGVEWVYFKANDSVLYDEIIAKRLGQVPLVFDPQSLSLQSECTCEGKGCVNCQIVFTLEKTGPGVVYSGDLKTQDSSVAKPVYPDMPITKLLDGQKLELEAVAVLGTGVDHSKWQASITSYQYYPRIRVDENKCTKCGDCVSACPYNVFEKGKANKIVVAREANCSLCRECVERCKKAGALNVGWDPTRFIFTVESVSGLDPSYIVTKSMEVLEAKAKEFEKNAE